MKTLDEIPINQAIEIYFEKHHALRRGDLVKLIELKKQYPIMFEREKDRQIRDMILYAKSFQKTERYEELRKLMLKDTLTVVTEDSSPD